MQKTNTKNEDIIIVGAGLAGSEAAFQCAQRGLKVSLFEMRNENPESLTPAHKTSLCAELVCSNSFRNSNPTTSAVGILQREMIACNSLIMKHAENNRLPAGSALAVDRNKFAASVNEEISKHPLINLQRKKIDDLPKNIPTIIATGPLTDSILASKIQKLTQQNNLAFFDAIAPLVYYESLDHSLLWKQSRYDKSFINNENLNNAEKENNVENDGDYINVPLDKNQYYEFINNIKNAETHPIHTWEKNTPYFEGCLPIEVMAERGVETLRFGPMKPVGLKNPNDENSRHNLYAVVQLRRDDQQGRLWNIVGFQTKMTYKEQIKILKTLPGFKNVEFARLGGLHRNTFVNAPQILNKFLTIKNQPNIKLAGQIVGVEGYLESAAIGLLAAIFAAQEILNQKNIMPPIQCALGALMTHVSGERKNKLSTKIPEYQPMNINFGLLPNLVENQTQKKEKIRGKEKKARLAEVAEKHFAQWQAEITTSA